MRSVSFYTLPRPLQDRLRASIVEGLSPVPLARALGGPRRERAWLGLTGASLFAVLGLFFVGYGSLGSSLSHHGLLALGLYVGLLAAAAFGYVEARRHQSVVKCLPIPRGVYLFPACLIDATSADLRVHPLTDGQIAGQGSALTVTFPGRTYTFTSTTEPDLVGAARAAQQVLATAQATADLDKLTDLDPLQEPRFSNPVGPGAAYRLSVPSWEKLGWAIGLGVGVVFGATTFFMRNATSDALLFSRAKKADTQAAYRAYLQHGTTHGREVERTLLPRAALKDASAQGTVEAVRAFRVAFPVTDIEGEYDDALRAAMVAALERAKTTGKLSALKTFAKTYPDHGLSQELGAAIHAVYMTELARVSAALPAGSRAETEPLVKQLFAVLEKVGPTVEVRFRRRSGGRLGVADKVISKTANWNGPVSYVTRYFDAPHQKAREEATAKVVIEKLAPLFDPELLTFVIGAQEPDTGRAEEPLPKVKVPTLFLVHGVDWSGHTYTSRKPHVTMVGLNFFFDAVFVLPADRRVYKTKHEAWKGITVPQLNAAGEPPIEERLYGAMASSAYESFEQKLLAHFVSP